MTTLERPASREESGHTWSVRSLEEMREGRQYLKYTFFKMLPEWRSANEDIRAKCKKSMSEIFDSFSKRMIVKSYSLIGTRADTDFMLWTISERLEDFQDLVSALLKSDIGRYLSLSYSYLSMTRRSEYTRDHRHPGQEGDSLKKVPGDSKYLFVYPFVKKREWYNLPAETRQSMMMEHIRVGHKYPTVKINTSYSFGLDDQEFVLSFESDHPSDFLELVMELRSSEASKYTQLEVPLFTCVSVQPSELLDLI